MARIRNVSEDERFIPSLGLTVGIDEVFDVPDEDFDPESWSADTWEVVTTPTTTEEN